MWKQPSGLQRLFITAAEIYSSSSIGERKHLLTHLRCINTPFCFLRGVPWYLHKHNIRSKAALLTGFFHVSTLGNEHMGLSVVLFALQALPVCDLVMVGNGLFVQ